MKKKTLKKQKKLSKELVKLEERLMKKIIDHAEEHIEALKAIIESF
jgi:hypothetical protein